MPYGRDGNAEPGIIIADTPRGTRAIARADTELTSMLETSDNDLVGQTVHITPGQEHNVARTGA